MAKAARELDRGTIQALRKQGGPFLFAPMQAEPDALDRLDISFRWGHYGIRILRCHLIAFQAGHVIPYHKHHNYEFHFIPRGQGRLILEDGSYPLHAGMFYLTGPQVLHQQEAGPREAMYELCLHLDIVPLEEPDTSMEWGEQWEIVEADACIQQLSTMEARPVLDQYSAMNWFLTAYQAWQEGEFGAFTTIRQSIIQILLRTARVQHTSQHQPSLPSRDMNTYRYQLATQYIRDNYARPLTLSEVAESLHICGRQLQRILDQYANETFSGYLERYRLAQLCQALTHSEQTIEQLAYNHGFSSGSYLHYVFKKRLGMTPAQYRQRQQQTLANGYHDPC
ncbi:AraC family transcriptional regulator [Ktedonobacter robiniae]|uniref:HTH araC/xylS-type domain-containing protein n=1 Tax=Ktedonobacter robiniae TaxID=2778365 RepID=A0ABQ3UKD2_9CHLR|nr:helix-turn-helix domain-containing protein [Ktedonobacter robiniae]GHO53188.1 hypothetical protein KSB_16630 [Ktedonobacter robiniae]